MVPRLTLLLWLNYLLTLLLPDLLLSLALRFPRLLFYNAFFLFFEFSIEKRSLGNWTASTDSFWSDWVGCLSGVSTVDASNFMC